MPLTRLIQWKHRPTRSGSRSSSLQITPCEVSLIVAYFVTLPAIPPALLHLTGAGLVMLVVASLSEWLNQRLKQRRLKPTQLNLPDHSHLAHLKQPLQWINQAKRLERSSNPEAAVTLYDQALQQYPSDFRLWHERGLVLAKLQRFEAAIESYDRAYQIQPQQRDLAHERGDALLQIGRYGEAIDSFDIFLQYAPQSGHVLADRGYALMQLGCYQEALRSLNQALSQRWEPGVQVQARRYQIEALRRSGQLEAAFAVAQTAVKQHPDAQFEAEYTALQQQLEQH